jgi:hypothetical protein
MTEVATTAAAGELGLLVLYGAILVFGLQQIGERYGTAFLGTFLVRRVIGWTVALWLTSAAGLALIAAPNGLGKDIASVFVLTTGIVLAALAAYRTMARDVTAEVILGLIPLLSRSSRAAALEGALWRATGRGDRITTAAILRSPDGVADEADLIEWLLGHSSIGLPDWLVIEIARSILRPPLDSSRADGLRGSVIGLLDRVLSTDRVKLAIELVNDVMELLEVAAPFAKAHGQLMLDVGRTIWRVGNYSGDAPRTVAVPEQLEFLKGVYAARRVDIWTGIASRRDKDGAAAFVAFLCLTIEDTASSDDAYNLILDMVGFGNEQILLESHELHELANVMRHIPFRWREGYDHVVDQEGWDLAFRAVLETGARLGLADEELLELAGTYGAYARDDLWKDMDRSSLRPGNGAKEEQQVLRVMRKLTRGRRRP